MAIMKKNSESLSRNQKMPKAGMLRGQILIGDSQPPRNRMLIKPQSMMMFIYSARKNIRNGVEEYSTKKPATNSDSASNRSKGGRWVSAREETKKITSMGKSSEKAFQCRKAKMPVEACAVTMVDRFNDPANNSTVIITKPMETS